jgi:hypothetical protein
MSAGGKAGTATASWSVHRRRREPCAEQQRRLVRCEYNYIRIPPSSILYRFQYLYLYMGTIPHLCLDPLSGILYSTDTHTYKGVFGNKVFLQFWMQYSQILQYYIHNGVWQAG